MNEQQVLYLKEICYNLAEKGCLLEDLEGTSIDTLTPDDISFILCEETKFIWEGNYEIDDGNVINYTTVYAIGNILISVNGYYIGYNELEFDDFKFVKEIEVLTKDYIELTPDELLTLNDID